MRINKIEFENFRNFKDHGEIRCSTDGKVTIVYGKNGDGKTTLHQLFQWVFYGKVKFNKTTTDRLYNLQYESECSYGETFTVFGCIDFTHDGIEYSLRRTYTYKKDVNDSEKIMEDLTLNRMDEDYNWKRMDRPKETIEKLLPSGLSDYFFFDGESMIADLRVKGRDSAGKLRKALYSMFDLDVVEAAISHIGRTDLKTTVLGKLYLKKGTTHTTGEITKVKSTIQQAQTRLETLHGEIEAILQEKEEKAVFVKNVSEKIGNTKSKAVYEAERKRFKSQRDLFLQNAASLQSEFGDAVVEMFPSLLIAKTVVDAKKKLCIKAEEQVKTTKWPSGLDKKLIHYLLETTTTECVCGNPMCDDTRKHIAAYLELLPPRSYTSLYNDFCNTAQRWSHGYDPAKIERKIRMVLDNNASAAGCDQQIQNLDEREKKSPDVENLIVARQQAENDIEILDDRYVQCTVQEKKLEIILHRAMKEFDNLTTATAEGEKVSNQIEIVEQILNYFVQRLDRESLVFSRKLKEHIQELIDTMLMSKRTVSVSSEFEVRVTDSFNDESKSEGQFAVVSFAYIGGILKMLRSESSLSDKEYPLVLDGPFSKLDPERRQNVIDTIPRFAPQVILFSKDDLQGLFNSEDIGRIWTIVSNDEKNIAKVEEGYLWS